MSNRYSAYRTNFNQPMGGFPGKIEPRHQRVITSDDFFTKAYEKRQAMLKEQGK